MPSAAPREGPLVLLSEAPTPIDDGIQNRSETMNQNQFTGAARDAAGRIQDTAGDLMGDAQTQARGTYNQVRGQAEGAMGDAAELIREQPLLAGLAILAIGYVIGRLRIL
jgi:uncharacterized protein YjbJ (UPF0337 family)